MSEREKLTVEDKVLVVKLMTRVVVDLLNRVHAIHYDGDYKDIEGAVQRIESVAGDSDRLIVRCIELYEANDGRYQAGDLSRLICDILACIASGNDVPSEFAETSVKAMLDAWMTFFTNDGKRGLRETDKLIVDEFYARAALLVRCVEKYEIGLGDLLQDEHLTNLIVRIMLTRHELHDLLQGLSSFVCHPSMTRCVLDRAAVKVEDMNPLERDCVIEQVMRADLKATALRHKKVVDLVTRRAFRH